MEEKYIKQGSPRIQIDKKMMRFNGTVIQLDNVSSIRKM